MQILIVDDDETYRKLLRKELTGHGYDVFEAEDGIEALDVLNKEKIDIVISDILMPRMDGFQLCNEIRNSQKLKDLPIILSSAVYTMPDDEKAALEAGADAFLPRPLSEDELIGAVQKLVAEKAKQSHRHLGSQEPSGFKEYSTRLVERLEYTNAELKNRTKELEKSEEKFRKLAEELKVSQTYLRTIIDTEPECVKLVSENGTIVQMNPAGLAMVEAENESAIRGKSVYSLVAPEYRQAFQGLLEDVFQGRRGLLEFDIIGLKGTRRHMETHAIPLYNNEQNIIAMLSLTHDVTQRKLAEHQIRQTKLYLESILENSLDLIFTVRKDGTFSYVNARLEQIFGYTKKELAGRPFLEFIPESRKEFMLEKWREINQGIAGTYETEVIRADGTLVNCLVSHSAVPGFDEFLVVLKDVTELKRAEKELNEANERLESFFNNTGDSFAIFDLEGNVLRVNKAFEAIYGWSAEEVIGMKLPMVPADLIEDAHRILKEVRAGNKIIGHDTRRLKKDGSEFEASVTISPIHDVAGNVVSVGAVSRNITERKQAEEERRALEAQLLQSQKMEIIGTLAAGIAHDFNNILGVILGYLSLIEQGKQKPENFAQSIEAMGKAIARGTTLVQQLLGFARKTEVRMEALQINEVTKDIINLLRGTLPNTIEIKILLKHGLPLITADANQVHQVFMNLCLNARDAMPRGGLLSITTEYVIRDDAETERLTENQREYVLVKVADTGIGMDEATKSKIFDPFFTTKEKGKGTGLGLSMVSWIIQRHNGIIELESEVGKGTTFSVYFPVQRN